MVRLLQRCQQLLRGAWYAADEGNAFSPSGLRSLEATIQRVGQTVSTADGGGVSFGVAQLRGFYHRINPCATTVHSRTGTEAPLALPWALSQVRGLFGALKPAAKNPQIHTHDKKKVHPQPDYNWMKGRFVLDRNGVIWHRQANYRHQRYNKSASQLTRLKRWKPLHHAYAAKLRKVGFKARYWMPPDPQDVPGSHEVVTGLRVAYSKPVRWSARPDLDPSTGDPALGQMRKPGPRRKIR